MTQQVSHKIPLNVRFVPPFASIRGTAAIRSLSAPRTKHTSRPKNRPTKPTKKLTKRPTKKPRTRPATRPTWKPVSDFAKSA